MFILTTAPKSRRIQAFAITQRTLTTLLFEVTGKPVASSAQALSVLRRRRPRIPSYIPTISIGNPASTNPAVARGRVVTLALSPRQQLFRAFFIYLQ